MQQSAVQEFITLLSNDEALRSKLEECSNEEELASKAVELGKDRGVIFTTEEWQEWRKSNKHDRGILDEKELDTIVGGSGGGDTTKNVGQSICMGGQGICY